MSRSDVSIEKIWPRIRKCESEVFRQIRGQPFTYTVQGAAIVPSTTNRNISRSQFDRALHFVSLANTRPVQHLQGPSYMFAILMDQRIREDDW